MPSAGIFISNLVSLLFNRRHLAYLDCESQLGERQFECKRQIVKLNVKV